MQKNDRSALSEQAANVIENIAYRVAENQGGMITVNHLAPYLPMSLGLIRSCLDNMVDNHSVVTGEKDGFPIYEFTACSDPSKSEDIMDATTCVSCSADLPPEGDRPLCRGCSKAIEKELHRLAETTGWPAKAVYEHEILYLAARNQNPQNAAELAGHSRFTLKRMQGKLKQMTLDHLLRQDLDENAATIMVHFPPINYPKALYQRNMAVIRRYPASLMEDMEIKVIRIILTLAAMLFCVFLMAFLRVPLPALIIGFIIVAPIASLMIWRRKDKPKEE
ncbi:MAG: hypothetical protein JRJ85_22435 [Deltaproteobacteria bacterium]|nr:hypothetical protein [Deltaproteobacteria bacterium]